MSKYLLQESGQLLLQENSRGVLLNLIRPIFLEAGSDSTQDLLFYSATAGTVASATDQSYTGPRSIKVSTGGGPADATFDRSAVLVQAGSRISFRFRFDSLPAAIGMIAELRTDSGIVATISLTTGGLLNISGNGITSTDGTTALSANTWYRIYVTYTITSTTVFRFDVGLNGTSEISATAGTLTNVLATTLRLGVASAWGTSRNGWYDDIYVDGLIAYADPGDVRVTSKRPVENGLENSFPTQIGAGGSGYGTGHSPQVNEQPLSQTNGWRITSATGAEEFNVEGVAIGDVNLTGACIVGVRGWIYAGLSAGTATRSMFVNGTSFSINLTATPTMFTNPSVTPEVYPAGAGLDIGLVSSPALLFTDVDLYEAGILIAYT